MKRTDFYIIINTESGKQPVKVRGYMFEKCGHWFTVRRRTDDEKLYHKKWIISDFVSGLAMTDTDNKLEDIPSVISETMVSRLLELYSNRSDREELQSYAEMIYRGTYKNDPNSNMLELHQSQAEKLFN